MEIMKDILLNGEEAKSKLIAGVDKVANAVKITCGPGGRNVVLGDASGIPVVTKDGVSVANYIKLLDPVENMGAQLLKQASGKTVSDAGDGTTTSTILAQALVHCGDIDNLRDFKKGMLAAQEYVLEELDKLTIPADSKKLLEKIALTSSNNDEEIASIVSEIGMTIGKEGIINVELGEQDKTTFEIVRGYRMENSGILGSNFVNNPDKASCEFKNCMVLLVSDRLDKFQDVTSILRFAKSQDKPLVIICKEFSEEFIFNASKNFKMGNFMLPLKAPEFGDRMIQVLEDIAVYCNGEVINSAELRSGLEIKLGALDSIIATKTHTSITYKGNLEAVKIRQKQLMNLLKETSNTYDIDKLKGRIAKLSAGFGTITVGGITSSERKEIFDRYEDAVGAVMAAVKHGSLPGGGNALAFISDDFFAKKLDLKHNKGFNNVMKAIKKPYLQILDNASLPIPEGVKTMPNEGIDASTGELVDLLDKGIIDPVKVTKSALINAISVANLILSTDCVIDNSLVSITYE